MGALETYKFHDVCLAFPEATAEALADLAEDIEAHGLVEPIWVHGGEIIDGRNRLKACEIAGVEPRFQEWDGKGSLADFVLSKNLHRRHLTASQRAMIVQAFKPMIAAEVKEHAREKQSEAGKHVHRGKRAEKGSRSIVGQDLSPSRTTDDELAAKSKTSKGYVKDAARIASASPETAEAVRRGEKTIPEAKRELGIGRPKPNGKPRDTTPAGFVAIEFHEPEEPTRVGDVAEEIDEREAMRDEALSDEDWLQALPLFDQLEGRPLTIFRADALAYRLLEKPRRSYKHNADKAFRAVRNNRGAFIWRAKSFLGIDHPGKWVRCAAPEHGGCGGTGEVKGIGQCPECKGRGYRINNG